MRYLPDGTRMRQADAHTIQEIGIPSVVLMEHAALRTVEAMEQEKMEWTQLRLNPEQIAEASKLYFISAIPRLILLDPMGRIVCSTNSPDEIDEYLRKNI